MKKKQSDAAVGFVILLAFVVLLGGVIWLKKVSLTRSMVTYSVLFPKVGGLQSGDPVRVNGVENGSVGSIRLHGSEVAVQIKIDSDIPFTDSSSITVNNIGLMGERGVEIILSRAGSVHTPTEKGEEPDSYIPGKYDSGISEAIGMLGNIMGEAQGLIDTVEYVLASTVGNEEFLTFFGNAVDRLDTMTLVVEDIIVSNEHKIDGIFTDVSSLSDQLDDMVAENSDGISNIVLNVDSLSIDARRLIVEVDSLLDDVQTIITKVDSGDGTIAQLLNSSDVSDELRATLTEIDSLVRQAETDGLKLRVKLGFRTPSNDDEEE